MNSESSRSHLICSLVVTLTNRKSGVVTTGKLTLVDLAGSEVSLLVSPFSSLPLPLLTLSLSFPFLSLQRVDKSGATGEVLKEAQSINKSLSAIGDVIAALTSDSNHVPYRNHPLTMLMSDSIGGNAKTLMFVNCSPANSNVSESNSSLTFAMRCKDIKNNTSSSSGAAGIAAIQLNALKKELNKLKKDKGVVSNTHAALARPT
jgi:hypothetical protein